MTSESLVINIRGRKHVTPNDQIKKLSLTRKKLLGPIVAGGIIFSLSGLAMLDNLYDPFYLMILLISGIFLLLYGYGGSMAISIETAGGFHYYFIKRTGKNIEEFMKYFNTHKNRLS